MSNFFDQIFPAFVNSAQNAGAQQRFGVARSIGRRGTELGELARRRDEFQRQMEAEQQQREFQQNLQTQQLGMQQQQLDMQQQNINVDNQNAAANLDVQRQRLEADRRAANALAAKREEDAKLAEEAEKRAKEDQEFQKAKAARDAELHPGTLRAQEAELRKNREAERIVELERAAEISVKQAFDESGGMLDPVTLAKIRYGATGLYKDAEKYITLREQFKKDADQEAYTRWKDQVSNIYRERAAAVETANFEFRKAHWIQDNADKIDAEDRKTWDAAWTKAHQDYMAGYRTGDFLTLPTEEEIKPGEKSTLERMAEKYFKEFKSKQNQREIAPPPASAPITPPPIPPPPPQHAGGLAVPAVFRYG